VEAVVSTKDRRTRRSSQPEPAGWPRDKSYVIGGWLRWLTLSLCVVAHQRREKEMKEHELVNQINKTGDRVFFRPRPQLTYYSLATGSLASNTYRGFHRIDKTKPGAKDVFDSFFTRSKQEIISNLNKVKSDDDLDKYSDEICKRLIDGLSNNIVKTQLQSYNKIRKPVDIVLEHMVSMGEDFELLRPDITKHLFLPLDSQMFQSEFVFSDSELFSLGLRRNFTFKDVTTKSKYTQVQTFLRKKADTLGLEARIFFDLVWNDRFRSQGTNLFQTNP
jgi:hypothetical protein